jgi:hypothetical protein
MFLTPEIIALTIINALFAVFATIAFVNAFKIVLKYDATATTAYQYALEKKSYLSATIIKFIFYVKIPLFIFFVYTLDDLSNLLPGAMCAAGVVTATSYGTPLLFLKIINLYVFAFWIVLNNEDMQYENQPYLKQKFLLYCVAYFLLMGEIILESVMFSHMDINSVVDCCGAIFSTTSATYMAKILAISHPVLVGIFYGTFGLMVLFYLLKNRYIYGVLNIVFVIISLITLIAFFGTYIYEQPMHHCPFCLLQSDYNYIGYFLYIVLFIGTFFGFVIGIIDFNAQEIQKRFNISLFYNALYVATVSYYPIAYYLKNGVWL